MRIILAGEVCPFISATFCSGTPRTPASRAQAALLALLFSAGSFTLISKESLPLTLTKFSFAEAFTLTFTSFTQLTPGACALSRRACYGKTSPYFLKYNNTFYCLAQYLADRRLQWRFYEKSFTDNKGRLGYRPQGR